MNKTIQPLMAGIFGLSLLIPASYFMFTLLMRIFLGSTTLYYELAPSILRSSFAFGPFQLSEAVVYGPVGALLINFFCLVRLRLQRSEKWKLQFFYEGYWLNTAVILQSLFIFLIMTGYLIIEHYRY